MAQSTVGKYLHRQRKPPSQTWRTFLQNHAQQMASMDFFTVPTATFRILFVLVVLSHDRRRVVHFNVTEHPTEEWTAQQIREAFPWDQVPRYVIRDRDAIFGNEVVATTKGMCLDHVIVWNAKSLRGTLEEYFFYYERSRTHLGLGKDTPEARAVEKPEEGRVVSIPQVGGLHHRYQRRAA